jgi:hypothetical protein
MPAASDLSAVLRDFKFVSKKGGTLYPAVFATVAQSHDDTD